MAIMVRPRDSDDDLSLERRSGEIIRHPAYLDVDEDREEIHEVKKERKCKMICGIIKRQHGANMVARLNSS